MTTATITATRVQCDTCKEASKIQKDTPRSHCSTNRKRMLPPIDWLRSKYRYDPDTGIINGPRGKPVGSKNARDGYLFIGMRYRGAIVQLPAQRLAYALVTGRWAHMVAHINGDRTDNRWTNLKPTSYARQGHDAD